MMVIIAVKKSNSSDNCDSSDDSSKVNTTHD